MALTLSKKSGYGVTSSLWIAIETVIDHRLNKISVKYGLFVDQSEYNDGSHPLDIKWMHYDDASFDVAGLLNVAETQAKISKDDEFFKDAT